MGNMRPDIDWRMFHIAGADGFIVVDLPPEASQEFRTHCREFHMYASRIGSTHRLVADRHLLLHLI